jgi:hypothetical protein
MLIIMLLQRIAMCSNSDREESIFSKRFHQLDIARTVIIAANMLNGVISQEELLHFKEFSGRVGHKVKECPNAQPSSLAPTRNMDQ